ncbi:MAG: histidinol-phosphate transaminase [Lachnospiraceae bacterium]|nr:histidinol-phosphate transaminase [Lachnospiraceae bacterium]
MGFENNIRKVIPYVPGEQPRNKVIKLNTNECPYPPSPKVKEALSNADWERLRLYPDPVCDSLVSAIADHYGVSKDETFVGVGSDDVLSMCFLTYFAGNKPVLFPDITYSFYDVWTEVYRIPYEKKPLRSDFSIDPEDYFGDNGGVVIANPNAPTGVEASLYTIREILEHNKNSVVIADEAYIDFGGETALPLIREYDNLVVVRTMSKSRALAGMRIGYCFGNARLIKYLNDVKYSVNSYTMNMPALIAGKAAIEDKEYFEETVGKVIKTREWTAGELKKLGFTFNDSKANFIFAKPPAPVKAGELFKRLKQNDIYVRYFDKPLINGYLRISIGTDEEMKIFTDTLKRLMEELC